MSFVAVSSLESPEHARRKDPKIINVVWNLGKRCNYDCSYCSKWIHDNYSPHLDIDHAKRFIDDLSRHVTNNNKDIKISITGGEPFVHPKFLDILEYISLVNSLTQLTVVTNGSLPLSVYEKSSRFITNLTVSLHFEQGNEILYKTVEKIIKLDQLNWFLTVNVMALPGKFTELKNVLDILEKNNVKHILRKIDFSEGDDPEIRHEFNDEFLEGRKKYRRDMDQNSEELDQYSIEETEFLKEYTKNIRWNNIRTYDVDGNFVETNTDIIKSYNQNRFKNWHCYIGIDTLNVHPNGSIYRGVCMAGNKIGTVKDGVNWPDKPVICPLNNCICAADIFTRKAKSKEYLHLINDNI